MAWKDWSFERYRKEVDSLTLPHKGKIEFPNDGRSYEVDHRLQVRLAFNIGIDPRIVANPLNLRALLKEFNASRQDCPDEETTSAICDLIDAGFLAERFRPKTYVPTFYLDCPVIVAALENLSEDNPISQAIIDINTLASIPPVAAQRLHEARYGPQLKHFANIGSVRPQHRRFTATAFMKDGKWVLVLSDGNTRKHNVIHDYLMFYGIKFPETITLDIMYAESEEQANEDSLLLDAAGAGKNMTDLVNGVRRMSGTLDGIIIQKLNRGKSWMNVGFTTYHGTDKQFTGKEDIDGLLNAISDFYPTFQYIVNDIIAAGKEGVNTPSGFQDNVIAAMMRMYMKHGDVAVKTLETFVERRKNHEFGERDSDSPKLHEETQAIHVILDEIAKYDDGDTNEINYYTQNSVTGNLPRRILPNTNSDTNFKIIAGLICYGMEASMNKKLIDENLYKEFLGNYSDDKDENILRALAKHKVEDYFDAFWEN